MMYYRVREEFDQYPFDTDGNILVAKELFTERERKQLTKVSDRAFEQINIPRNSTYWSFGARFAEEGIEK